MTPNQWDISKMKLKGFAIAYYEGSTQGKGKPFHDCIPPSLDTLVSWLHVYLSLLHFTNIKPEAQQTQDYMARSGMWDSRAEALIRNPDWWLRARIKNHKGRGS